MDIRKGSLVSVLQSKVDLMSEKSSFAEPHGPLIEAVLNLSKERIFLVGAEDVIVGASAGVAGLVGLPAEDLVGRSIAEYLPGVADALKTAWDSPRPFRLIRKGGAPIAVSVSTVRRKGENAYLLVLDRTEDPPSVIEELQKERGLLKAVVETAVDGILTINERGTIITSNPAATRIFGYAAEELIGRNVKILMPSPYQGEHDQYLANYLHGGAPKVIGIGREVKGRRKDGSTFPLDLAVSETRYDGGVIFTGIVRDITDRVAAAHLRLAKDAADDANAAKSEFLSRMSHELRTPLNAVLGFAQILDMRYEDPQIKAATQSILRAGQHLLNLINEVLDLSRIEAGRMSLSLEPVLLSSILGQARDIIRPIAEKAAVTIEMEESSCRDVYVLADKQRLLQVFINLLSNGVKFNRPNGRVRVACEDAGPELARIVISDTGIGLAETDLQRLFQPFERFGDLSVEGTGLGLVLSRRFIELMQGKLDLRESTPNGSTFYIELRRGEKSTRSLGSIALLEAGQSLVGSGSVLYIEDNLSNLRLIEMVLEGWPSVQLIPAMQGKVGLDLAFSRAFDVILLDLHLPDMPGAEILRRLKADPSTASIPVIVISADATSGQIRALMELGADEYLTKPLDIARFIGVLKRCLPNTSEGNPR